MKVEPVENLLDQGFYKCKRRKVVQTVVAPTAKAAKSVTEVIVMLTPACFIVVPILIGKDLFDSSLSRLFQHWTMTNMSSIPMPSNKNGRME